MSPQAQDTNALRAKIEELTHAYYVLGVIVGGRRLSNLKAQQRIVSTLVAEVQQMTIG